MKRIFYKTQCMIVGMTIIMLGGTHLQAANLITNGDFELWDALTEHAASGLKQGSPTGWTIQKGDGDLSTYQSFETPTKAGSSVMLANVSGTPSRFISPNTAVLSAGTYKLSFKMKGRGVMTSITLTESTQSAKGNWATNPSSVNLFPSVGQVKDTMLAGSDWTLKEYIFSVSTSDKAYKLILWPSKTAGAALENATDYYLVDDIVLEEFVDNTICTLSELRVNGSLIDNFISTETNYALTLPVQTTLPAVTAKATDEKAVLEIKDATNLQGTEAERTAIVKVTAADGISIKEYKILYTMTTDIIRMGFPSTDLPTAFIFSSNGDDWRVDASATRNHGSFWGSNSLRPNGGTIDAAYFIIPKVEKSDILSFYIKKRADDDAAKLIVLYQDTTAADDAWIELENYTEFADTFQLKMIELKKEQPINIKFHVQKTTGIAPFNIDDILITSTLPMGIVNGTTDKIHLAQLQNGILIRSEGTTTYSVCTLTGQQISNGIFENEKLVEMPTSGCYVLCIKNKYGNLIQKIIN